jgi:hypothetical protein
MKFYVGLDWPVVVFRTAKREFVAVAIEGDYDATKIRSMSLNGWRGGRMHRRIPQGVDRVIRPQELDRRRLTA